MEIGKTLKKMVLTETMPGWMCACMLAWLFAILPVICAVYGFGALLGAVTTPALSLAFTVGYALYFIAFLTTLIDSVHLALAPRYDILGGISNA